MFEARKAAGSATYKQSHMVNGMNVLSFKVSFYSVNLFIQFLLLVFLGMKKKKQSIKIFLFLTQNDTVYL